MKNLIGKNVPDTELEAYFPEKDKVKKIKLSDYQGKWLVMVFYPADFSFICPTELEELAEKYKEFKKAGVEVVSVSTDTAFVHKAWHDQSQAVKKVKFPMAADPTGKLCREMGTYLEKEGLSLRGSFIIDPKGVVRACEIHDNEIGRSTEELFRKVQAAKFIAEHKGQVCPASWKPGKKTLKPGMKLVGKI